MPRRTPPAAPADRETVLAWMWEHKCGYKAAATHFGIPSDRVKQWRKRTPPGPPKTPPAVAVEVVEAVAEQPASNVLKLVAKGGDGGREGKQGEKTPPPPSKPSRAGVDPKVLTLQDREDLRAGVRGALAFLAEPIADRNGDPIRVDWRERDAAARALRTLLEVGAQVLAFEEKTNTEAGGGGSDAVMDALADRLKRRRTG